MAYYVAFCDWHCCYVFDLEIEKWILSNEKPGGDGDYGYGCYGGQLCRPDEGGYEVPGDSVRDYLDSSAASKKGRSMHRKSKVILASDLVLVKRRKENPPKLGLGDKVRLASGGPDSTVVAFDGLSDAVTVTWGRAKRMTLDRHCFELAPDRHIKIYGHDII